MRACLSVTPRCPMRHGRKREIASPPLRHDRSVSPDEIAPDDFDDLVRAALDQLPDEAAALVADMAVIVREEPDADEAAPGTLLLGTFRGVPHTATGSRVPGSLPDLITLFRIPILLVCGAREEVAPRVLKVLGHEVGHALGLSEGELRALGWF